MTHGAKNGGSFSEMMGQAYQTNPSLHFGSILTILSILYLHIDTDTCIHIHDMYVY